MASSLASGAGSNDEFKNPPDKDARTVKWDSGLLGGREYKTGRYTFATTGGPNTKGQTERPDTPKGQTP